MVGRLNNDAFTQMTFLYFHACSAELRATEAVLRDMVNAAESEFAAVANAATSISASDRAAEQRQLQREVSQLSHQQHLRARLSAAVSPPSSMSLLSRAPSPASRLVPAPAPAPVLPASGAAFRRPVTRGLTIRPTERDSVSPAMSRLRGNSPDELGGGAPGPGEDAQYERRVFELQV
jgi:hypothetical protein